MLGRDENDPLFLQLKEAQASVLEPFLGKSAFAKHGQRVVEGQRLTQAASDIMLGWIRVTGLDGVSRDFYMRQLWDGKGSALVEMMNPRAMTRLRGALRPCARESARPLRRRDRDRELSRRGRQLRPRAGLVRRGLRRPERARLPRPERRRRVRPRRGRDRPLTVCELRGGFELLGPATEHQRGNRVCREPDALLDLLHVRLEVFDEPMFSRDCDLGDRRLTRGVRCQSLELFRLTVVALWPTRSIETNSGPAIRIASSLSLGYGPSR